VAYQLLPEDPLIDNTQCTLDANLMKTLGANSIRVYHVDPQAEHDDCMKTFADAGIYIWLDLDTFNSYIQGPGMSAPQWNETQYKAYQEVMDAFHNYDNLGGFFVGNEVLTSPDTDVAAPFVKAAARDMKAYRDGKWQIQNCWMSKAYNSQKRIIARSPSATLQLMSPLSALCCRTTLLVAKTPRKPSTSMVSMLTNGMLLLLYFIPRTRTIANIKQVRPSNIRHVRIRLSPDERIGIQHPDFLLRNWLHC
jgi:hypothetical protein